MSTDIMTHLSASVNTASLPRLHDKVPDEYTEERMRIQYQPRVLHNTISIIMFL